jgi:hypothetical protein
VPCLVQYTTVYSVHNTIDKLWSGWCCAFGASLVRVLHCGASCAGSVPFLGTAGASYGSVLFVYVATRRIIYSKVVRCTCYHKWYSTVNPTVNSWHGVPCMT